jgi:hypothetical protein
VKRQAAAGEADRFAWVPLPPGYRRHPTQPYLMRAEHGNPVRVRAARWRCGRPIARGAQSPGGTGCLRKRMPAAERQQETSAAARLLRWGCLDNWPDTGPGARA